MKFLKEEEIIVNDVVKSVKKDDQGKELCDITVKFKHINTSLQGILLGRYLEPVYKKVIFYLNNIITELVIDGEIYTIDNDSKTNTLNYIAENADLGDNLTSSVFVTIDSMVLDNIIIKEDDKKKSLPQVKPTKRKKAA
jgi:hypothetical protein